MKQFIPVGIAVFVSACCCVTCDEGNTVEGKFTAKTASTGEFRPHGPGFSLTEWKRKVSVLAAPGTRFDVALEGAEPRIPAQIPKLEPLTSSAPDAFGVEAAWPGFSITAKKPGAGRVEWTGYLDGSQHTDALAVTVAEPDQVTVAHGCAEQATYYKGMPAVVRFSMHATLDDAMQPERVWGVGRIDATPNENLEPDPSHSNAYEWVFTPKGEFDETTLTTTTGETLAMKFQAPPEITGIGMLDVSSGTQITHPLQIPLGHEQQVRVFPMAGDMPMCTTVAEYKAETRGSCKIRSTESTGYSSQAASHAGLFHLYSVENAGDCVVKLTLVAASALAVAGAVEIVEEITPVLFYSTVAAAAAAGGRGISSSDDDDDGYRRRSDDDDD